MVQHNLNPGTLTGGVTPPNLDGLAVPDARDSGIHGGESRKVESNDQAAALLAQARSQLADIKSALSGTAGNSVAQLRLLDASAQIQGVIAQIYQAVNSGQGASITVALPDVGAVVAEAVGAGESKSEVAATASANLAAAQKEMREYADGLTDRIYGKGGYASSMDTFKDEKDKEETERKLKELKEKADAARASGTPEGLQQALDYDKQALGIIRDHTSDAAARERLDAENVRMSNVVTKAEAAKREAGSERADFQEDKRELVEGFLQSKGVGSREIAQRIEDSKGNLIAAVADRLDENDPASKTLLAKLDSNMKKDLNASLDLPTGGVGAAPPPPGVGALLASNEDIGATLRSAGVQLTGNDSPDIHHGVTRPKISNGMSGPSSAAA